MMSKRVGPPDIAPEDLRVGSVYFTFGFVDKTMVVPIIDTYVYIGSQIDDGEQLFLFRNASSRARGDDDETDIVGCRGFTGVYKPEAIVTQLNEFIADQLHSPDAKSGET